MANRYAVQVFWYGNQFVELGALRDSTEAVVVANPSLFQSSPLTVGTQIHPVLAGYLTAYPRGPEVS